MHLSFLDPNHLIATFGTLGTILIIFAESFFAFFLPGDSLLFSAGIVASQDRFGMNIWVLALGTIAAAVAGNQVGYLFGRKVGPAIFNRPDSRFFKQEFLEKTHHYFERFGPKTIVLARFIPVVRTFACVVAGAGRMEYRLFLTYNIVGAVLWCGGLTVGGYLLGNALGENFPIDQYLLPIIGVIVVISVAPALIEYQRARKHFAVAHSAEEITDLTKITRVEEPQHS